MFIIKLTCGVMNILGILYALTMGVSCVRALQDRTEVNVTMPAREPIAAAAALTKTNKTTTATNATSSNATYNTTCKHPTDMWGDPDPSIFYFCDEETQTAQQVRCAEGRGYFNGLGYLGCIPYAQWPACIDRQVVVYDAQLQQSAFRCDDAHMQQPWRALDPHKFYMCPDLDIPPSLLNCAAGKGFVYAEMVGCASWALWRNATKCEAYY